METESLIQGIKDIAAQRLAPEAIFDMAPVLIDSLTLLIVQQRMMPFVGNDYVYICGKVTGLPRREALVNFTAAEQRLRGMSYKTINPMVIVPETASWNMAMRLCIIEMMKHCNKIFYLDNWLEDSEGSRIENSLAVALSFENIKISDTLKQAVSRIRKTEPGGQGR